MLEGKLTRYIYSNHLQSATLELDEQGQVISYEEYHPYGTTSYQVTNAKITAAAKRYRFTGKERDEESGLYYHGARYYAPWLGRWTAVDTLESKYAPLSPYNYCLDNPVGLTDDDGKGPTERRGVQLYGVAEATGTTLIDQGANHSVSRNNIQYQEATISPAYDKNEKLVGYNVYDNANSKLGHPVLQIDPKGLADFKEHYRDYMGAARFYYINGEPSEGMKKLGAGLEGGNQSLAWSGIKQENKKAWSDPAFVAGFVVSIAQASLGFVTSVTPTPKLPQTKNTSATDEYVKLLTEYGEYDATKTLYRGTSGTAASEKAGGQIFFTDNLEAANTYVKNGGHVIEIKVSQFGLKRLEQDKLLRTLNDNHKGIPHPSYEFISSDLREAVMRISKPLRK